MFEIKLSLPSVRVGSWHRHKAELSLLPGQDPRASKPIPTCDCINSTEHSTFVILVRTSDFIRKHGVRDDDSTIARFRKL